MKRMLLFFLVILFIGIFLQLAYSAYYFRLASQLSSTSYARKTTLGSTASSNFKLFIAGDSVGAGVGASSFETSVAGRLGAHFAKAHYVNFENVSVSGHKVKDVLNGTVPTEQQDLIVLIVSSNNLFRFTNLGQFEKDVEKLFAKFTPLGEKILLIGPGRIFDSKAVPLVMRPIYRHQGQKYAKILKSEAQKHSNVIYVNPFETSLSIEKYGDTLAIDKFHPGDSGHEFWFDMIINGLQTQTPGG